MAGRRVRAGQYGFLRIQNEAWNRRKVFLQRDVPSGGVCGDFEFGAVFDEFRADDTVRLVGLPPCVDDTVRIGDATRVVNRRDWIWNRKRIVRQCHVGVSVDVRMDPCGRIIELPVPLSVRVVGVVDADGEAEIRADFRFEADFRPVEMDGDEIGARRADDRCGG